MSLDIADAVLSTKGHLWVNVSIGFEKRRQKNLDRRMGAFVINYVEGISFCCPHSAVEPLPFRGSVDRRIWTEEWVRCDQLDRRYFILLSPFCCPTPYFPRKRRQKNLDRRMGAFVIN